MNYTDLYFLIPSHSLEDFPTELGDKDAASLLNAFTVLWHPALLAGANVLPSWHRADEPPGDLDGKLVTVPTGCSDWLPGGWVAHARQGGAVVIDGLSDRDEMLAAALEPLELAETLDPELTADFLALGTCYLQLELLTRHMHHFDSMDEVYLQREAVAGAQAVLAHDRSTAETHLRTCFEILTEARERFYPVDCYLIDLCLLVPDLADEHFERLLDKPHPFNLLATAEDLETIAAEKPRLIARVQERWNQGTLDVIGGEHRERPVPLVPLESMLFEFQQGRRSFQQHLGRRPTTWARRRYGFSTQLPQILTRLGYHSALHVALDDGIYPDTEQSKIRWEGCDGSVIDAVTRIPLAADSATSFLRFPQRLAESMEQDQVAAILLARWPEMKTPWLEDLLRMHAYSATLGRFVSFDDFFQHTDDPGRLSTYEEREYLSPFFIHSAAKEETDPISRYVDHYRRRARFDAGCWFGSTAKLLTAQPIDPAADKALEQLVEQAGPDGDGASAQQAESEGEAHLRDSAQKLADVILSGAESTPGFLLLNPLSFTRRVSVDLPDATSPPAIGGAVKAVQFDDRRQKAIVEVPGSGYVWLPADSPAADESASSGPSMVEERVLRNRYFEVHLNGETGGISQIKGHGRSPNRLSQRLAFRFPRERTITIGEGENAEQVKTYYSEMTCRKLEIVSAGPALAEAVSAGEIVDQQDGSVLAEFQQTIRVWRGLPLVELDIELDPKRMPEGDPWSNYFASRFAWNDSTASLTRSVLEGAHGLRGERIEAPHYFEIADSEQRTTILTLGLPFHRKTGPRMLDTILATSGDTRKRFRLVIAIDQNYPMQAARDALVPVTVLPTETGPPRSGASGWFFHLDQKNVQITRILPPVDAPPDEAPWEAHDRAELPPGERFALRLVETEGRARRVQLRCFKTPELARQRDFQGRTLSELRIEDDAVIIDMTAHEIADVEMTF